MMGPSAILKWGSLIHLIRTLAHIYPCPYLPMSIFTQYDRNSLLKYGHISLGTAGHISLGMAEMRM